MSFDHAYRLFGNVIALFPDWRLGLWLGVQLGYVWASLFTCLTMQPIDGVVYGLSNLVELIISCRSPVLTLCEQNSQPIRH